MKCTLFIFCAVAVCFTAYAATGDSRTGVWTASLREDDPSTLEISIFQGKRWGSEHRNWNNIMGFGVPLAEVTGLAASDIGANAEPSEECLMASHKRSTVVPTAGCSGG